MEFQCIEGAPYKHDYPRIFRDLAGKKAAQKLRVYRGLCKQDLFFLLHFGLRREDVNHPWIVEQIREVEEAHNATLDLWAREHYKSTIKTYGLPIQKVIQDPEKTIAIFSHTRPIAKGFLRQIKHTLEDRDTPIVKWFPEIFWKKPKTQAPKWSEDEGLIIKRKSNRNEATFEAWGLVDGQPVSKHFDIRIYDDVVTRESVTTPEQIKKTLDAFELSESLGVDGGEDWIQGTYYHFADLYAHYKKRKDIYTVRERPATHDGTATGRPVLLSRKRLDDLRRRQGQYVFSCQQLLKPMATQDQRFKPEWLRYYGKLPDVMNRYLLGDPANEKKEGSDYTVYTVIGIDAYKNRYLLDGIRERLNLKERWTALRDLWLKHGRIQAVGYEKYGKDSDISYFEEKMEDEGIYFDVEPLGGRLAKGDRILRLVPWFENGKFFLPRRLVPPGKDYDLIQMFLDEEYYFFPFVSHDDIFDCMARLEDLDAVPPSMALPPPAGGVGDGYDVLRGNYG